MADDNQRRSSFAGQGDSLGAREFFEWAQRFEAESSRKRHDQNNAMQAAILQQDERWQRHANQQHETILGLIKAAADERKSLRDELVRQHEPRINKLEDEFSKMDDLVQQLKGAVGLMRILAGTSVIGFIAAAASLYMSVSR